MTSTEIAVALNTDRDRISKVMYHYYAHIPTHYFKRLKIKSPTGGYRYKVNDKGLKAYIKFTSRILKGYSLNLYKNPPEKMPHFSGCKVVNLRAPNAYEIPPEILKNYVGLTRAGEHDMKLSKEDLYKRAGITKEVVEPTVELEQPVVTPVKPLHTEHKKLALLEEQLTYGQIRLTVNKRLSDYIQKLKTSSSVSEIFTLQKEIKKYESWLKKNKKHSDDEIVE